MSDKDSSEEREEEPTAKRLEKAREDGQVARSQELSVAAMMIGVAFFLYLFGGYFIGGLTEVFASGFTFDRKAVFDSSLLVSAFGIPTGGFTATKATFSSGAAIVLQNR